MANSMLDHALADREQTCNMPRIPTGRYPAFSTTLAVVLNAAGEGSIVFEAERDMLFIGMSASVPDAAPLSASISMTYCNTKMLVSSSARTWAVCCDRKPPFLVGVRENKKLEFFITGGTPAGTATITLHGFQGSGCCG